MRKEPINHYSVSLKLKKLMTGDNKVLTYSALWLIFVISYWDYFSNSNRAFYLKVMEVPTSSILWLKMYYYIMVSALYFPGFCLLFLLSCFPFLHINILKKLNIKPEFAQSKFLTLGIIIRDTFKLMLSFSIVALIFRAFTESGAAHSTVNILLYPVGYFKNLPVLATVFDSFLPTQSLANVLLIAILSLVPLTITLALTACFQILAIFFLPYPAAFGLALLFTFSTLAFIHFRKSLIELE